MLFIIPNAQAAGDCTVVPRASSVINARDTGARGDGLTDDTAAIQLAIDRAAGTGGTVLVPDGTYMVNALVSISLKSDMTLRLSDGAILKAMPNAETNYSIIKIEKVSNANLVGGTLQGERYEHLGKLGEWGMGVYVNAASDISIAQITAKDAWGDGFYIRGASKNITFCAVKADNNRRQGMSIISVDGLLVKDSIFSNTNGTAPQAGLDIEPNENDTVNNVKILNSRFLDNRGIGVQIYRGPDSKSLIKNVFVSGNTITGNKSGGLWIANSNHNQVIGNTVQGNLRFGILFAKGTMGNQAMANILANGDTLIDQGENILLEGQRR